MDLRFAPLELSRVQELRYEAVVLPFFAAQRPLRGALGLLDWRLCGHFSRLVRDRVLTGQAQELTLIPVRHRLPFDKALLLGLGARSTFDETQYRRSVEHFSAAIRGLRLRSFALSFPGRCCNQIAATDAMRWFLSCLGDEPPFDELTVLDTPEAQRVMLPIVEAERRRRRAIESLRED